MSIENVKSVLVLPDLKECLEREKGLRSKSAWVSGSYVPARTLNSSLNQILICGFDLVKYWRIKSAKSTGIFLRSSEFVYEILILGCVLQMTSVLVSSMFSCFEASCIAPNYTSQQA